jgi:hypothetical protein
MSSTSQPTTTSPAEVMLNTAWSVWCATPGRNATAAGWEMKKIVTFRTLDEFWRIFNVMKMPSELGNSVVELAVFREGVEPEWGSEPCSNGGRWNARMDRVSSPDSLDQSWLNLVLGAVGETLVVDESLRSHVLGVALSSKGQHSRRVAVWLDTKEKDEVLKIGNSIKDNFRIELTDKDIGEMLFHEFESGNKNFCVIANTGKKDRKVAGPKKSNESTPLAH